MNQKGRIRVFCTELWLWFEKNKRTLPWRDISEKNLDHKAYLILVSEVMLQQTQASRVITLYKQFLQKFPRIEDLSKASNREILIAWRGLGYNNRALRLRDAAKTIVSPHPQPLPRPFDKLRAGGVRGEIFFPRTMEDLQKLPGVGHYTASAIRNFAFGIATPCIDVNIRRILHRFFIGMENPDGTWKKSDVNLLKLAREVLQIASPFPRTPSPEGRRGVHTTAAWHAALMDFGALVCTKNNPKWNLFSVGMRSCCKAYGKEKVRTKKVNNREPGREIAGRFIPNRIIRGRIIEVLRDHELSLSSGEIGKRVTVDWTMGDHQRWLDGILQGLQRDRLVTVSKNRYRLHQ